MFMATTLNIHPENSDQDTALRLFLDALHIPYEEVTSTDDTEYLNASPVNAEHLRISMEQAANGQVTQISLDDIC